MIEEGSEVVVLALRSGVSGADAIAAHVADAGTGAVAASVFKVGLDEDARSASAIDTGEEQSGGAFQDVERRAMKQIGKANKEGGPAAANGEDQAAVGIKLHVKMRGTFLATDAGEHALKERFPAGDTSWNAGPGGQFLRLTGGGAAFFLAFSASFKASCVPSMASSRLSL